MPTLDRNTNWDKAIIQNKQTQTYTFHTKDEFVDKDIEIEVSAQAFEGSLSGNSQITNGVLESSNNSGIAITSTGEISVTKPGWLENGNSASGTLYLKEVTMTNGKTLKINDGIYDWTLTVDANGNVSLM